MSELKVYHCNEWHNEYTEFYMKSEADMEIRHQKYKRCLAMALWCSAEIGILEFFCGSKIKYYKRWQKRWLKIADKYKEGNV